MSAVVIHPAYADCSVSGAAIFCDADSAPGFNASGDFQSVDISNLTGNIEGRGISIVDTGNTGLTFDVNVAPFAINIINGDVSERNGFHLVSDGSINGTLIGPVTGQVADNILDTTNTLDFPRLFAAVGFESAAGIDVTVSQIDVALPNVSEVAAVNRADVTLGRFAGLRAEAATGDIAVVNSQPITVLAGTRSAEATTTGRIAGAYALDFITSVSDLSGVLAQGDQDLVIIQTGAVSVSGGDAIAAATATNNVADAQAWFATTTGIYVPSYTTTDGETLDDTLPRFNSIEITTGDVTVEGGDVVATATSPSSSPFIGAAQTTIRNVQGNNAATGILVGGRSSVSFGSISGQAQTIDVSVLGNVNVSGGDALTDAQASVGEDEETAGRVWSVSEGQDAVGITLVPAQPNDGAFQSQVNLAVSGSLNVIGGDATGTTRGSGSGQIRINPLIGGLGSIDDDQTNLATGGDATGIRLGSNFSSAGFEGGFLDFSRPITVQAGSATVAHNGDNADFRAWARSGRAVGIQITESENATPLVATISSDITIIGADSTAVVSGDGVLGQSSSVSQTALNYIVRSNGSEITYTGTADYIGGQHSVAATDGAVVDFLTAADTSLISINPDATDASVTLVNEGTLTSIGADLSFSGPLSTIANSGTNLAANQHRLVGQAVVGITIVDSGRESTATVDHRGSIDLTAGSGPAGLGRAIGINVASDFSNIASTNTVIVRGSIEVEGGHAFTDLPGGVFPFQGAGIAVKTAASTNIIVDGGFVKASGFDHAAIHSNGRETNITLENGATVIAEGEGAAGINLSSFDGLFLNDGAVTGGGLGGTHSVVVGRDTSVASALSTGIRDSSELAFLFSNSETLLVSASVATIANETRVDLAGTVTGGDGIAIDLGTGTDELMLRSSGIANGNVLLGPGDDRFSFEDGYSVSGIIDGGQGNDSIEAAVAADTTRRIDLEPLGLANFEVINKTGLGSLEIAGSEISSPYLLMASAGTTIVRSDQLNLSAAVGIDAVLISQSQLAAVSNAGTLSAGTQVKGDVATLSLEGDLILEAASTLVADIASDDTSDRIIVGGSTTLAGTLQVEAIDMLSLYSVSNTYTLIESTGAITGSFDAVTDTLPDLDAIVSIGDDNRVTLALAATMTPTPTPTPNPEPEPAPEPVLSDTSIGMDVAQAQLRLVRDFSQILSRRRATYASLDVGTNVQSAPISRHGDAAVSIWAAGSIGTLEAGNGPTGYNADMSGFTFGLEAHHAAEGVDMTFGAAFGRFEQKLSSGLSDGDAETWAYGVYANVSSQRWHGSLSVAGTDGDTNLQRGVPIAGTVMRSLGETDLTALSIRAQASYNAIKKDRLTFGPVIGLEYARANRGAYSENGLGVLNQAFARGTYNRTFVSAGVHFALLPDEEIKGFSASTTIRYDHGFADRQAISSSAITSIDGATFVNSGALEARGQAALEGVTAYHINKRVKLHAGVDARIGSGAKNIGGQIGLTVSLGGL